MSKVRLLLDELHDAEVELAHEYDKVADRQGAEHEVWHTCHDFALRCRRRAEALRDIARRYGEELGESRELENVRTVVARVRHQMSEVLGRTPAAGILLLRDLRHLYLEAEQASVHWIMLGQVAQALRDDQLLSDVDGLHQGVLTEIKWLKARIKEAAPQVLASG